MVRNRAINDAHLDVAISNREITMNRFSGTFPGDTDSQIFGFISNAADGSLRFEGNMECKGKNFRDFITWAGVSPPPASKDAYGAFTVKSDISITANDLKLSESDVQVDDTSFLGAAIVEFGPVPAVDARMKISTLNLDRYIPADTPGNAATPQTVTASQPVDWLTKPSITVHLRTTIEKLNFLKEPFAKSYAEVALTPGKLELANLVFSHGATNARGSAVVTKTEGAAHYTLDFKADALDSRDVLSRLFITTGQPQAAQHPVAQLPNDRTSKWSRDTFDFSFFHGKSVDFKLAIDRLMHKQIAINDVVFEGGLHDNTLNVDKCYGKLWGGELQAKGKLMESKIPSVAASFSLAGVDAVKLLAAISEIHAIQGLASVSGAITSYGVDPYSFVSNMDGSVALVLKNAVVNGFDISTFSRKVVNLRSVTDVINLADQMFSGGATAFSDISGNFFVKSGTATTPGIRLATENTFGYFSGDANIAQWSLNGILRLTVSIVGERETPSISTRLVGALDHPEQKLDTSSVESFIARSSAERLLQRPQQ